eukprot:CAMPEP_0178899948 /NCGR_PEP_ID=MMETSP0786-20121207/3194_1 /TAXON_ID=186022 /ORGANISM="Thalassionema frauenfeldii, Strain CCMP 1798" /LENGTH=272 /DNA_ID=CAMNT_0020570883 /DNA_START=259 /DNA_END=1078 /DNA_ORIENTATION=+
MGKAQTLLGLDVDAQDHKRYNQIKNWNLNSQAKSVSKFKNLSFSLVAKVASEEIAANMKVWLQQPHSTSRKCAIAFVRDPLARFISGYVEFEWRFVQAGKKYKESILNSPNYTFHNYDLGSKERAAAFISDLVAFNVIDWLHDLPPNLAWFDNHVMESPQLFHRNAIAHICPLVGRLGGKKIDFLGQLEHISRDWKLMADHCGIDNLGSFERGLTSHITSNDPQGTKKGMKLALEYDCKLKTAVCLLLKADYEILSDYFHYNCIGCNDEVIL